MPLNPETIASLSPAGLFALIKSMSDADIRSDLGGEHRQAILEAVFAHFPAQFRPDKAGDRSARIDFRITGGPGDSSDTYAVVVENGACHIEPGASDAPDLSLMLGPVEFLKLITGSGNPAMMFMMGKIKARGDIGLATALANWFDTPEGLTAALHYLARRPGTFSPDARRFTFAPQQFWGDPEPSGANPASRHPA